ncbi:MAG: MarR family winged helix-turn-helix transcriptional regulator [Fimbriimonadaceae bacterium]
MFVLKELPSEEMMAAYAGRFETMDLGATRDALQMLRSATVLLKKLENLFRKHELSQTRFLILIILEREGGELSGSEVLKRLDVSRPVMTKTLQGLARSGYVEITGHPEDKRALQVKLVKAGGEKLAEVLPDYFRIIREHMK